MGAVSTEVAPADARVGRFPVIEIFGPTVQGEGPQAGQPAYFVRFGGCDYRCEWCDSMYAVEPDVVRREASFMTDSDIAQAVGALPDGPELVVLSGGNPALLKLGGLVERLQSAGFEVAVETQGSVWRDWLADVDHLVVSPKPPSSKMDTEKHRRAFATFMENARKCEDATALKIVVFDEDDLAYASEVAAAYPHSPLFLSVGTPVDEPDEVTQQSVLARFRWLCEHVASSRAFRRARVLPQLHVLAWGTARGV